MTSPAELEVDFNTAFVHAWEGEDENNGEWPYPTQYARREVCGSLAEAIRRRLGVEVNVPVEITEEITSGGWSEFTQENDYSMVVECAGKRVEFLSDWEGNGLVHLLAWLDQ